MTNGSIDVSVLFIKEGENWVAQCLQYDIAGQGDSIPSALLSLEACFVGHIVLDLRDKRDPMTDVPRAPNFYWKKFEQARALRDAEPFRMPASTELAPELAACMPEPWAMPRPRASEMRVC